MLAVKARAILVRTRSYSGYTPSKQSGLKRNVVSEAKGNEVPS